MTVLKPQLKETSDKYFVLGEVKYVNYTGSSRSNTYKLFTITEINNKNLKMGVTYIDDSLKEKQQRVKEIELNAVYRSSEVYQACSFDIPTLKSLRNQSKNFCIFDKTKKVKLKDPFAWSKVYNSPIRKQENDNLSVENNNQAMCFMSNYHKQDNVSNESVPTTKQTRSTSVTSFDKRKQPSETKSMWCKRAIPKLLCPCCTGGGDDRLDRSQNHSKDDSYESINLKYTPDIPLHLHIDPSLMSFICMHRSNKSKHSRKLYYERIIKLIIRNTCKNTVTLFKSFNPM
ncbi:hypothetical protein O3G_MSEX000334 [Manduca sexta]|nr:hypothetical protein O3G_MSEX000334 [Manduca sexta]